MYDYYILMQVTPELWIPYPLIHPHKGSILPLEINCVRAVVFSLNCCPKTVDTNHPVVIKLIDHDDPKQVLHLLRDLARFNSICLIFSN